MPHSSTHSSAERISTASSSPAELTLAARTGDRERERPPSSESCTAWTSTLSARASSWLVSGRSGPSRASTWEHGILFHAEASCLKTNVTLSSSTCVTVTLRRPPLQLLERYMSVAPTETQEGRSLEVAPAVLLLVFADRWDPSPALACLVLCVPEGAAVPASPGSTPGFCVAVAAFALPSLRRLSTSSGTSSFARTAARQA
eukprot:CAMPEP_0168406740 /NCGR_PEP_ID=MMETSP0228-20121227/25806_1 /TAXON_ID=133427 /ORGANISM="Protoceratium reticulatum, Strain CCCM 535 (=CCMP 1889)" /LENGTH=201 /DNA_ID=CAMNT_0008420395 /DNA_START=36 /DNA_END=637 /DNA_ORIENTATION=-